MCQLYRRGADPTLERLYRRPASREDWWNGEVGGLYDYRPVRDQLFISEPAQVASEWKDGRRFRLSGGCMPRDGGDWVWRKGRGLSLFMAWAVVGQRETTPA